VAQGARLAKGTLAADSQEGAVTTAAFTDELTALEETRARLEAALASDENWRALRQSRTGDEATLSAAHRARNTRLKMALAENALYLAWRHVVEAVDALRQGSAGTEQAAAPAEAAAGEPERRPKTDADLHRDLSQGVARAIAGTLARRLEAAQMQSTGDEVVGGGAATEHVPEPLSTPMPEAIPRRPAHDARGRGDPDAHARSAPLSLAGIEPDEATVTFVRRSGPSAAAGAEPQPFQRGRGPADEVEPAKPLSAVAVKEEAEVTILSPEDAKVRREAEARAGTVRRLRKTLSGDQA
jgi:hypothetical protein